MSGQVAHERSAQLWIRDDSDVVVALRAVREVGARAGLHGAAMAALATAVSEIARNMIVHARGGELTVEAAKGSTHRGVVVVTANDSGPGIADIARAMSDGYSTGAGLGLGLPSARRLVDEFEIESQPGAGTTVVLRKWA